MILSCFNTQHVNVFMKESVFNFALNVLQSRREQIDLCVLVVLTLFDLYAMCCKVIRVC